MVSSICQIVGEGLLHEDSLGGPYRGSELEVNPPHPTPTGAAVLLIHPQILSCLWKIIVTARLVPALDFPENYFCIHHQLEL